MLYSPPAHARRANDHYATPPDLVHALVQGLALARVELPRPVYDPCHGEGALLDALKLPGFGSDLFPDAYLPSPRLLTTPVDASDPEALADAMGSAQSLVTNPPYGRKALGVVQAGVELVRREQVRLAAFLLPLPWTAAGGRVGLMRSARLVITCAWRPEWVAGTGGGGKMIFCWVVWTREPSAFPVLVTVGRP